MAAAFQRKRGRPAGGSPSVNKSQRDKMVMEQKMALVHQRLALLDSESDKDADVVPTATMVRSFSLSPTQIVGHCRST